MKETPSSNNHYSILKNDLFGRYMVASKNLKAGEVILVEKPILLGPQLDGPLICFNCCQRTRNCYVFCRNCDCAIICNPKCLGSQHTTEECATLKSSPINGRILIENPQIIFPLRCFLISKYDPDIWKEFMMLEPHLEARRNTPLWRRHKVTVEQIFKERHLVSETELNLIETICGVLDVNAFEIRPPQNKGVITNPAVECLRGIYLKAALMAHDCIGNTHLSVDDDFVMKIHASVDIAKDSPIFFNYSNVLQGSLNRKQHLREGKYFECSCKRCKDPTELETEISSLKCHKCRNGLIRQSNPEKIKSDWICENCKKTFSSQMIYSTVEEGRRRIEEIDHFNVVKMDIVLNELLATFHSNHYLILELKQDLIGFYSRLSPNKQNLSRKIELCNKVLEVFAKVEPGISRLKAMALYQLQSSIIDLAHKNYRTNDTNVKTLIQQLRFAESVLKEAIKNLLYEPAKSPEGKISLMALSELKMLRMSIRNIERDLLINDNDNDNDKNKNKTKNKNNNKNKESEMKNNNVVDDNKNDNVLEKSGNVKKKNRRKNKGVKK